MEGKIVEEKKKVLFHLFISTLYLSAFTFGGGYVIVSLLKKKVCQVEKSGRITLASAV